ncbi:MAG: hypothetical protein HEP71_16985 [Roseivirga sp.]|nr:hypothetical protein [Roseivirga sp.]
MSMLEIRLKNPIDKDEVTGLRAELVAAEKHDYLIIDLGMYDFVSGDVHAKFRNVMSDMEPCLMKFKKLVLVHSPFAWEEGISWDRCNICLSKEKAVEWLMSGEDCNRK